MLRDQDVVEEVRQRVDIVELIGEYVPLKRQGKNYVGLCPFHAEKTPSFTVSPEKQMFYCFGCGAGGNVYTFLMRLENLEFREALQVLAARAGITLSARPGEGKRARLLEANRAALAFFAEALARRPEGEEARLYLKKRGLDLEAAARFGLGYAPREGRALAQHLLRAGFREEELLEAGLLVPRAGGGSLDRFRGRLIFPIFNLAQQVIGFGGRVLGAGEPKYLNSPETPVFRKGETLYALNWALPAIREQGFAVIVEGYFDALTSHLFGFRNVVASLGTSLTREQAALLCRYTRQVVIAYDADAAGEAAALRGLELLQEAGARVLVAVLPQGSDPDSFLRERGAEAYAQTLAEAKPLFLYKLAQLKGDFSTPQGKAMAVEELLPDLARVESAVEREAYVHALAQALACSPEAVQEELRKFLASQGQDKKAGKSYNKSRENFLAPAGRKILERKLLQLALRDASLAAEITRELGWEFCEDPAAQEILSALAVAGAEEPAKFLERLKSEEARKLFCELLFQPVAEPVTPAFLAGTIKKAKLLRLRRETERCREEILAAEKEGNFARVRELLGRVRDLQRAIHELKVS